jgi:hypothetical protein
MPNFFLLPPLFPNFDFFSLTWGQYLVPFIPIDYPMIPFEKYKTMYLYLFLLLPEQFGFFVDTQQIFNLQSQTEIFISQNSFGNLGGFFYVSFVAYKC